jgi:hypothetical protein
MKEKQADVTDTLVCLQTVAEQMITTVTVSRNYCNSVDKRTYTAFQLIVIKFCCRKLQVSVTADLC